VEKNIVIHGAGYAGILTAKKLAKKFKKNDDIKIAVVDKNSCHTMLTELHEVAANRVEEDSIRGSLKRVFAGRNVSLVLDTIVSIDYDKQVLSGKQGEYAFDYQIMASGSKPAFYGIPGPEEYTYRLWSYENDVKLKPQIYNMFIKATIKPHEATKRRFLTFLIAGAGFTGVEMAGELAEWVPSLCKEFEIDRKMVQIIEVDLLDRVVPTWLPSYQPRYRNAWKKWASKSCSRRVWLLSARTKSKSSGTARSPPSKPTRLSGQPASRARILPRRPPA